MILFSEITFSDTCSVLRTQVIYSGSPKHMKGHAMTQSKRKHKALRTASCQENFEELMTTQNKMICFKKFKVRNLYIERLRDTYFKRLISSG